MGYRLRNLDDERKFSSALSLEALASVITQQDITALLRQHDALEERERKLSMAMTIWILIAMNLFANLSITHVIRRVCQGLRFIWPDPDIKAAGKSAFSYRRYQLGPDVLADLFHQLARPLAAPTAPGAFLFG